MTWFKVDDKLHDHRKRRLAGLPAMGLWAVAGSWSADNDTYGFIPADVVGRWAGNARALAKKLVDVGLWVPTEQDGEAGWRFHDWDDFQPTKAEREADKAAARERMRAVRAARAGRGSTPAEPPGSEPVRANTERTGGEVRPEFVLPRPGPARPDPNTYLLTLVSRLAAGDARGNAPPPAEVIASWQETAGPDIELNTEAREYLARFGDRPPRDERGAWLGWLRKANERAATATDRDPATGRPLRLVATCTHPDCLDGWAGEDDQGRPRPCPSCKPRASAVEAS